MQVKAALAKPYKPRTKGKVEKCIPFVAHDFLTEIKDQVQDLDDPNRLWEEWVAWYNPRRPHASLGDVTPAHRLQASRRVAPADLERLLRVEVSRKVARDCTISAKGRRYELPADLIGRHVWVGQLGDQINHRARGPDRGDLCPLRPFTFGVTKTSSLGGYATPGAGAGARRWHGEPHRARFPSMQG